MTIQKGQRNLKPAWWISGLTVLAVAACWALLSDNFVFGVGHAERPIPAFLLLWLVLWAAFLAGFLLLRKRWAEEHRKWSSLLLFILTVGVLARLLLLPSELIQENDVYRYVLDGQVLRHGENPYRYSPLVIEELASPSLKRSLQQPQAREVLRKIGYPEIPTVYPPAAQFFFAAGTIAGGWNWMGQRWIFLAVDLMTMVLLLAVLIKWSIEPCWILLYAWNPLVLKEVANSAHVDVLVALFLAALFLCFILFEETGQGKWLVAAGCCLGLAVLSKLYPLILAPACFFYLNRRTRQQLLFTLSTLVTVTLGYLPFLTIEAEKLTRGLTAYASGWQMNEGAFGILAWLSSQPRLPAALLILAAGLVWPLFRPPTSVFELAGRMQWVLLLWFLLIPAPFPWYAIPLVALLVFRANPAVSVSTLVLSGAVALYYCSFLAEYRGYPPDWWFWIRLLEHSLLWLCLIGSVAFPGLSDRILNISAPRGKLEAGSFV